jgi:ferredoxin
MNGPVPSSVPGVPLPAPKRIVEATIDGRQVKVAEGTTIFEACRNDGVEIPVLCRGETLTPKNACRVCMVEVEGSRTLVPSCSRPVEQGMVVTTRSERVDTSRRMVLELLGSSVDLSTTPNVDRWNGEYGVDAARHGGADQLTHDRDERAAGYHHPTDGRTAESVTTTPNASCATSVSTRVALSGRTRLRSGLRGEASTSGFPRSTTPPSRTRHVCIAATACRSVPLAL